LRVNMKWIALLSIVVLSACTTVRTTEVVEYRQVTVQPVVEEVVVVDDPVDVTETEIDYY